MNQRKFGNWQYEDGDPSVGIGSGWMHFCEDDDVRPADDTYATILKHIDGGHSEVLQKLECECGETGVVRVAEYTGWDIDDVA